MPPAVAPSDLSFRTPLDRDVYHVIKKLESADDRPFKSVSAIYEAIKRSNSSLSRQKKRPLEDAIDRALQIRKQELQQDKSDDPEAAIDEPEPPKADDDLFPLNRQLTKLWKMDKKSRAPSEQPTGKKRRCQVDSDGNDERASGVETAVNGSGSAGAAAMAVSKLDRSREKTQHKSGRFVVEHPGQPTPWAGCIDIYCRLKRRARLLLQGVGFDKMHSTALHSGQLLAGPSGVGKKSLVRYLASDLGVPIIDLKRCFADPERTEKSLSEAFDMAISLAPSIIFIGKIDHRMSRRGSPGHHEHHSRAVCCFETQMARISENTGRNNNVLAMATTSSITDVDAEVLKLGFEVTQIKIPDCQSRQNILKVLTRNFVLAEDVDLAEIARRSHGCVGSDLAAIVKRVDRIVLDRIVDAADDNTPTISCPSTVPSMTMDDFKVVMEDFTPSLREEGFTVIPSVTWDQVGALDKARQKLQTSIIGPIKHPELYRSFGLGQPAGVLLWGPPGCGKTLIAQAVANEAQASFILIDGPELLNKYVGESERAVRELFQRARSSTPCILFFDEIDSIVPPRSTSVTGVRMVNALLAELDGVKDRTGIYVIGTTNRPEMIDEAMLRPGRLSVQLLVDLPTASERVDILRTIYRTRVDNVPDETLEQLAAVALDARCTNFSGADLSGLHIEAAEHALKKWLAAGGPRVIAPEDWEFALAHTRASVKDPASYKRRAAEFM